MLFNWSAEAECRKYPNPDIWFQRASHNHSAAKRVCAICPVILECRIYSLNVRLETNQHVLHGVWGGLSFKDRMKKNEARERLDEALEILWRKKHWKPSMTSLVTTAKSG